MPGEHGVPLTLVKLAVELKMGSERQAKSERDENLLFDEVWCVFDVDTHPNLNDARQLASANGVKLAVSNPCFELWLLLHFRESPGARHHHDVQKLLEVYLPGCGKHLKVDRLLPGYADAVRRAARLDQAAEEVGEAGRNPTTGVHGLTESIRSAGQE